MNFRDEDFVKSPEYINWLVDFLEKYNQFDDDGFLYNKDISKDDEEKCRVISIFFRYIKNLSNKYNIFNKDYSYNFKLKGNFYNISTIVGQGAVTLIHKIEETDVFVKVDEEYTVEELKETELIQYIVIDKELAKTINPAKIGVHIAHACTICAVNEAHNEKFKKWYQDGKLQKKIVLVAPIKTLEKLEEDFYSVRDLGLTEVEENTLIAVSLGIMTRKEAKPFIKRLQTWK